MAFGLKLVEHMDVATCAALARAGCRAHRALQPKIQSHRAIAGEPTIEDYFRLVERAVIAELNGAATRFSQSQAEAAVQRFAEKFSDA